MNQIHTPMNRVDRSPPTVTRYGYGKHIATIHSSEKLEMFLKVKNTLKK